MAKAGVMQYAIDNRTDFLWPNGTAFFPSVHEEIADQETFAQFGSHY
jgi:hypothetical protein